MGDARVCGPTPPMLCLISGCKHSGKSELIRFICYTYARDFSYIVVFAPTSLNGFYQKFLPEAHVHDDYDEDVLKKIMVKQTEYKKRSKPVHCLLIFEDVLGSATLDLERRKDNPLNSIWTCNRHYNISAIVVTQRLKGVPKALRENADWVFITRSLRSAWPDLHESFGTMERKAYERFLEESTANYKIIRYKANVSHPSQHYSVFSVPAEFLTRQFRLQF